MCALSNSCVQACVFGTRYRPRKAIALDSVRMREEQRNKNNGSSDQNVGEPGVLARNYYCTELQRTLFATCGNFFLFRPVRSKIGFSSSPLQAPAPKLAQPCTHAQPRVTTVLYMFVL